MVASKKTFKRLRGNPALAIPVNENFFAGGAQVGGHGEKSLANVLRGLAMDHARTRLEASGIADFTDNSTGVAASTVAAMAVPSAAYDGSASGASPAAAFNTQAGVFMNAAAVVADNLNNACARIGLPQVRWASGTIAAAATIPAQTKALTATSGATAIDYTTGVQAMSTIRNHIATLVRQANALAAALGVPTIADNSGGSPQVLASTSALAYVSLATPATALAGTGASAGATSISDTVMDAFLDVAANNLASLAAFVKEILGAPATTAITDSTGGTASNTLAAISIPAAAAGAATTSAPKAGFDTELALYNDAFGELVAKVNVLAKHNGLTPLTDNTGASPNNTMAAMSVNLTAVDGSSGTSAVDQASGRARITSIRDNIATLAAKVNELVPLYGEIQLVDSSGGTAGSAVEALAATATGVGGVTAVTLLDADVDAFLVLGRNALSSLAATVNGMIGATVAPTPLHVVAA